ncbi:serine--tRNA ligase [Candidatus Roizmanbacteria bacterium]|nr:serine--tRNA ligase [Candidatus Roizmanbacteria bacterium]
MLDIKLVRKNPKLVQQAAVNKGYKVDVSKLLKTDEEHRKLFQEVQKLHEKRNRLAKEKNREEGEKLKKQLREKETKLANLKKQYDELLLTLPNLPKEDVPIGGDEAKNVVVRIHKEPPKLDFAPLDHIKLGQKLDLFDIQRAAKVSGSRFGYLKNEAALLEFALVHFAFQTLTKEGFIPVVPPALVKDEVMRGLGYMEQGGEDDMFVAGKDRLFFIGTAEHSIVPMHKDETLSKQALPKRYVGFSSSFRREAGSYGKDTRGIFRVHQFDKVEMVSFTKEEDDDKEHEYLLSLQEKLFQALDLSYRVVNVCTGELGFPTAKKYDIEVWFPSQNRYREVTSASTTTDFQARRLHIKYQEDGEKKFVHILNGTAFAIGRTLIAILENYQQKDGSVLVPKVLQPLVGFEVIQKK